MATDPPIIITGGSVNVEFDEAQLSRRGNGHFRNDTKKIKRVEITGDYDPATGQVRNGNVLIKIYYNNP